MIIDKSVEVGYTDSNMKLYSTLSHQVKEFRPINKGSVGIYTCGPTVYDYMHIGNLRTFILMDILIRVLQTSGYQVKSVQNITDIDDKIIKRAKEKSMTITELSDFYTQAFLSDLNKLCISPVSIRPKATEHIGAMIKYIEVLIKKGFAYQGDDGSVYFDISKFSDYGKLSGLSSRQLKPGIRILSDEYSKDDVSDFALWKVETDQPFWDSPWGKGRPGWHIECSAMSGEYLGETFDIHLGGVDLIFPHHENEIAQSEAKTGKPFVNYFVHGEHMLVDGKKMSKSLGNFYTLADLEKMGFEPMAFKYLILTVHYRQQLNFTFAALRSAQSALKHLKTKLGNLDKPNGLINQAKVAKSPIYQKFIECAKNDLSIPQSIALLWDLVNSKDTTSSHKSEIIVAMDQVLGIGLGEYLGARVEIPIDVIELADRRLAAKRDRDYHLADKLRDQINNLGYQIDDLEDGTYLIQPK